MHRLSCIPIVIVCLVALETSRLADAQSTRRSPPSTPQRSEPAAKPVPIKAGNVPLTPKNTKVQFIGTHVGPDPNPRTGYFTRFTGNLTIDRDTQRLRGATLDMETNSLLTPIPRLTNHLQSVDFFSVKEYPRATFAATKIEATDAARGKYKMTGKLTIRDISKPLTIPVVVKVTDAGVVLNSQFKVKRSDFGMTFGPDRVVDDVALTITVGQPTPKVMPE